MAGLYFYMWIYAPFYPSRINGTHLHICTFVDLDQVRGSELGGMDECVSPATRTSTNFTSLQQPARILAR
jgi:hypothetical protein